MEDQASAALQHAKELRVPREFAKYDDQSEPEVIIRLEQWKQKACDVLLALRDDLRTQQNITVSAQAAVVYATATFDGEGPWVLDSSRKTAQDVLSSFEKPNTDLLERILRDSVKPVFALNPHPNINADTGRKLPHAAGGALGQLDYLEGQEWKSHPELYNVLSWSIRHADDRNIERLWHMFVPPIMTYLDDYQAAFKLHGVDLVVHLLTITPAQLLRRTGMDVLLATSLKTCLTFLHNPETPELIRRAVTAYLRLVECTTSRGSVARFDQLCSLLGDSIIGNVWVYASRELDTLQASLDTIPEIVEALDIGTARYLKALIPQLVLPLIPAPENDTSVAYKLASTRALSAVIRMSTPRIPQWRGTILEAVLKCWVDLSNRGISDAECSTLKDELRSVCAALTSACHPVVPEFDRLLVLDSEMFGPLLGSPTA
ncbi:uncharacterized protein TRAVEDRAFT_117743 [Trametes versicolor FP-101664 SS1]|uniref:uncharacterized protein n=1 Tax=Trametes versicolor (strain FP-101664) TaxID=717944 RepID=UPI000462308B|nr:uncharacterized protein TRAVEDRAFT_117743 [Trametes versicolor FP-101664 SS1]EIW62170.1 hypothetical protein TRAVEDRAFT_117743 [Trametes versicolor FP-101664 SS1]